MSSKRQNVSVLPNSSAIENPRMSGEERRRQLIRVAMRLFSQKGFTGTTTKEIAAAANVNEAIIFRHFATKDDLYAAILDYKANEVCAGDWLGELREHAERRDDVALFRAVAEKKLAHHRNDENDQFLRLMFYSALEGHTLANMFLERQVRPIREFLCAYIEQRQREGAFRNVSSRAVVMAFIGALNHHVMTKAFFHDLRLNMSDEEAVETYTNLLLCGLGTEDPKRKSPGRTTASRRTSLVGIKGGKPHSKLRKTNVKAGIEKSKS